MKTWLIVLLWNCQLSKLMQHYLNKQRVSILIATFNNKIDPIVLYRKSSAFLFCFMLKRQLFLQLKPNSISWSSILPGKDGSLFCPNTYKRKQPVNAMNIFQPLNALSLRKSPSVLFKMTTKMADLLSWITIRRYV